MAARIPPPPVQPVYRFLGTALGASMWFFVCWSFGHEEIEAIGADPGHIDLLQGKERRYLPPPDILAHTRILLPPRKLADTTSQGRFFLVGSILGITRREIKRDRGRRILARAEHCTYWHRYDAFSGSIQKAGADIHFNPVCLLVVGSATLLLPPTTSLPSCFAPSICFTPRGSYDDDDGGVLLGSELDCLRWLSPCLARLSCRTRDYERLRVHAHSFITYQTSHATHFSLWVFIMGREQT